ncbi:MAG: MFS transporter [Bacteroidetes bacterium]|nr:MFS transporter [Bacteroidota bacterium]
MSKQLPATRPRLNFWDIWNMSFGFLGIQFGFALQNANVSRIFETLGANVEEIPILWIAAPLTGLLVQPIVGYFSDRTWNKLGRRKPYFLFGAIFASIALFYMPNAPALWIAAGMLWIMDASINVSMEPFRAFVGDNLPASQRTTGFAMQSFFIGIGAVVASLLPWIMTNWLGISNIAEEGVIPDSVKFSFYIGAVVFFLAVLWTVMKSKEYNPEELAAFEANEKSGHFEKQAWTKEKFQKNGKKQLQNGGIILVLGLLITFWLTTQDLNKELYVLSGGIIAAGLLSVISGWMQQSGRTENGFVAIINDFQDMPTTMKQLAIVQFFSWFPLFAMWIYTTAGVTSHVYGTNDTTSQLYNDGADWVSVCFGVYNLVAAIVAFGLPILAKQTSRRVTHMICLILGGVGLLSVYFITNPTLLIVSMVGIGIAWASILSMPYAMLTGSIPSAKMGYYMGVFNYFIVIPQLIAATILGFLVSYFFDGSAIYALVIGGISMILAGVLCLRVDDKD